MLLTIGIAVVAAGALTGLAVLAAVCLSAGMTWIPEPSDCIIVLGAHVWMDGRLSHALEYRCEAALQAWRDGVAPALILCGGQGKDEPCSEADAMRRYMIGRGVPESALFVDETSRDTRENLVNARAVMQTQGFRTCAVCTSNYHLRRALWQARDEGLDATGIAAPSTRDVVSFARGRLREACSWILYFLRRI